MNTISRKYIHEIKKRIPFCKERSAFVVQLKKSISAYMLENPSCSYDDIVSVFGEPEEISLSFREEYEHTTYNLKYIGIIVACIAIIIFAAYLFFQLKTDHEISESATREIPVYENPSVIIHSAPESQ